VTGQDDPQDGPAINEPWIRHVSWAGAKGFAEAKRELWRFPSAKEPPGQHKSDPKGDVVGYWKAYDTLTQVVVRDAGHMVPHDQPEVSQVRLAGP
jgi:vitellogenic carboxypeptidase-like protein